MYYCKPINKHLFKPEMRKKGGAIRLKGLFFQKVIKNKIIAEIKRM